MPSTQTPTQAPQTWDRARINDLLLRSPQAVERALVVLYQRQTADEQQKDRTVAHNKRGFGAFDAELFSSFARQVEKGRSLSPNQVAVCLKRDKYGNPRIGRYWAQLLSEINADTKRDLGGAEHVVELVEKIAVDQAPIPDYDAYAGLEEAFVGGAW